MIGLSLSACVCDIINGRVRLEDVEKIISGTRAPNKDAWYRVVERYKRTAWYDDPAAAEAIANSLYEKGLIVQPRVNGQPPPLLATDDGLRHWVKSEEEIKYCTWVD